MSSVTTNQTPPPDSCVFYWLRHVRSKGLIDRPVIRDRSTLFAMLLLISGIETNSGPRRPKIPCGICGKACKLGTRACDHCDQSIHRTCVGMSSTECSRLGASDVSWYCPNCNKPNNSTILYSIPEVSAQNVALFSHSASDISLQSRSSVSSDRTDSTFNIHCIRYKRCDIFTQAPRGTATRPAKVFSTHHQRQFLKFISSLNFIKEVYLLILFTNRILLIVYI